MSNEKTLTGKVKFFSDKGFGFVTEDESGKEYFVHISGVNNGDELKEDDEVSFELAEGKKGLICVNVNLL
jgi:cold shock protein